jgi:hypothetical protein
LSWALSVVNRHPIFARSLLRLFSHAPT